MSEQTKFEDIVFMGKKFSDMEKDELLNVVKYFVAVHDIYDALMIHLGNTKGEFDKSLQQVQKEFLGE